MENHTINVPGAQEFARPRTRRDFFKSLAVAGAGATAASMLLSKQASAKTDDVDIANFALTLEYLEADFYAMALDADVLSGDVLGVVENLADHEAQHVTALTDLLDSVGATPVEKPTFTFPTDAFSSQASIPEAQEIHRPHPCHGVPLAGGGQHLHRRSSPRVRGHELLPGLLLPRATGRGR